jgi:hypothetical protein
MLTVPASQFSFISAHARYNPRNIATVCSCRSLEHYIRLADQTREAWRAKVTDDLQAAIAVLNQKSSSRAAADEAYGTVVCV